MLELLNQLDGFEATKNIKVIMATNRIDILDPALLRPGRIDRKIEFPPPNEEARLDILKIHSRKMNLTRGINLRKIAELMPGASGAEVKVIRNIFMKTFLVYNYDFTIINTYMKYRILIKTWNAPSSVAANFNFLEHFHFGDKLI